MQQLHYAGIMCSIKNYLPTLALIYNDYGFEFNGTQNDFSINLKSGIKDLNAKTDFDFLCIARTQTEIWRAIHLHTFLPSGEWQQDTTVFCPLLTCKKHANEFAIYIQDD